MTNEKAAEINKNLQDLIQDAQIVSADYSLLPRSNEQERKDMVLKRLDNIKSIATKLESELNLFGKE